jgi:hypothetical protein
VARLVAVQIGRLAVPVGRLDAHHDVILDERVQQAVVRVVRTAHEHEGLVVAEDIAVQPFPVAVGIIGERIGDGYRPEMLVFREQRARIEQRARAHRARHCQELPPRYSHGVPPLLRIPIRPKPADLMHLLRVKA